MNRLFSLNGLLGFFILVVVLLSVVAFLGINAWKTQKTQATNPYVLETPNQIKKIDKDNSKYYKLIK